MLGKNNPHAWAVGINGLCQILTGAKGFSGTGEQYRPNVIVCIGHSQRSLKLQRLLAMKAVEFIWSLQRNDQNGSAQGGGYKGSHALIFSKSSSRKAYKVGSAK